MVRAEPEPLHSPAPSPLQQSDEITLRELVLELREYWVEIRRNWMTVTLIALPFVVYFAYRAFTKPVTYTAQLTFMLNEDKGGGGIASMLGQFGGLLGSSEVGYQLEKILEIARARRIIASAFFEKCNLNGQEDFYANHVIRVQHLHDKWKKDSTLTGFLFTQGNPAIFNRTENKALLALYGEMIGDEGVEHAMFGTSLNNDTGIMTLSLNSRNETLAIDILLTLYKNVSAFYIEKSIQRESETFEILAQKRDSLARVLNSNDYAAAAFDEKSRGLLQETQKVPSTRYRRNTQILSLMYSEALKNAEFAEFALKNSTPFLSLIDVPIPPIKPDPQGRAMSVATGILLGIILGTLFIVGRKAFRQAMQ